MTSSKSRRSRSGGSPCLIAVDRRSSQALYKQIYDAYRDKIARGELRGGDPVASTRELARDLRISRLPVLNAYAQLLAEGHFESRAGSGTFVAVAISVSRNGSFSNRNRSGMAPRPISTLAQALPKSGAPFRAQHLGAFQVGQPDLRSFPIHIWSRLVSRYSRELTVAALQYGNPLGLKELRRALAVYLRTSRGVRCEPEQIMVVSGSQQGLDICARVLLEPGAPVWVEEPGYWLVHQVLAGARCQMIPVPVDSEGLNVAAGIERHKNARAAFVTPSHQFPLGVTMSASRRFQLLEWARKTGAWILEDDYDSEYRYGSMPIASLQGLDTDARVIYVGTLSKVLFPSLRLGYLVIPLDLVSRFVAVRQAMDICPSDASQAALAAFIREGHFYRHIRKMRRVYEERRKVLVEEIQRQVLVAHTLMGDEAGMHLSLLFRENLPDREIVEHGRQKRLWLSALSHSYLGRPRSGMVLGFGNTPVNQIPEAVALLNKLISSSRC